MVGLSTLLRTKGIVLLHSSPAGARCSNDVSRRSCCANIDKNSCKYKIYIKDLIEFSSAVEDNKKATEKILMTL